MASQGTSLLICCRRKHHRCVWTQHLNFLTTSLHANNWNNNPLVPEFRRRKHEGIHAVYRMLPEEFSCLVELRIWDELNWPTEQQHAFNEYMVIFSQLPFWTSRQRADSMRLRAERQSWERKEFDPLDCREQLIRGNY